MRTRDGGPGIAGRPTAENRGDKTIPASHPRHGDEKGHLPRPDPATPNGGGQAVSEPDSQEKMTFSRYHDNSETLRVTLENDMNKFTASKHSLSR